MAKQLMQAHKNGVDRIHTVHQRSWFGVMEVVMTASRIFCNPHFYTLLLVVL